VTWVRRNRWALLALAVLVPGAVLAAVSIDVFDYYGPQQHHPRIVAKGDPARYTPDFAQEDDHGEPIVWPSGPRPAATLTLTDYTVVAADSDTGREVGLLPGTEAVAALIHVDARDLNEYAYGCEAILTAPGPQGERTWEQASYADIDYTPGDGLKQDCYLADGGQYDWEAVFVVPEGVGDIATLSVTRGAFPAERVLQLDH
jgi:hypothetical protein